jgi:NADH-quinone oxidoreductase subunit M
MGWLSLVVLISPLAACLRMFFLKEENDADKDRIRRTATLATQLSLGAAILMWIFHEPDGERFQFLVDVPWVKSMNLAFILGVDGIGIAMVLLTSVVIWAGCYVSRSIQDRVKEHYILLMALVVGVFGVFLSLDLFFFYFFYEMAVIPMYLLIGVWGSRAAQYSKEYATMKLTLYLTAGAVFALVGLLAIYNQTGTFDMRELSGANLSADFQKTWFPVLFLGFACIIPMWPLHSWSPIGHAAAPSAVSMLHAGVLMKLGAYAVLRIAMEAFPIGAQYWLGWVGLICCMNIIYGGLVAMAQKDMKFIIGFSSSSHMGYVLLGLASMHVLGLSGAVFLMFAHGIMTALAFGLIGWFYDQTHTRVVDDLGGMIKKLPFAGTCFVIMAMASAGLPGFANFASELLVILGAWKAEFALAGTSITIPGWVPTMAAVWGIVISATYLLRAVRDAWLGPPNPRWENLQDATTRRQKTPFVGLIFVLMLTGCFPSLIVDTIKDGVKKLNFTKTVVIEKEASR